MFRNKFLSNTPYNYLGNTHKKFEEAMEGDVNLANLRWVLKHFVRCTWPAFPKVLEERSGQNVSTTLLPPGANDEYRVRAKVLHILHLN